MAAQKRTRAEKCAMKAARNRARRDFHLAYPDVPHRVWRHRWPIQVAFAVPQ